MFLIQKKEKRDEKESSSSTSNGNWNRKEYGINRHFVWVEDGPPMYFPVIPAKGTLIILK